MRSAVCTLMILLGVSGCVDFACYSSVDYARKEAAKFCSQGNGDKKLCDSLKIDGNVCGIEKDSVDKCVPDSFGIQTFIRIRDPECRKLDEETCTTKKFCSWTYKDSLERNFYDPIKPRS